MTVNQILILMIVAMASLIIIVGLYFLVIFLLNKKRDKKTDDIFDPTKLVEEESLMNVMDEKRNLEFKSQPDREQFVQNQENVEIITPEALSQEKKVNPFGIDMTMGDKDSTPIEIENSNSTNKFIK